MKLILTLILVHLSPGFYCLAQDQNIPPYVSLLSKYIQLPSEQYQEKAAGLFFMRECSKKGLHTEILTQEDTAFNFIASLYPLSLNKPNIIFLNHIDVVPPGDTALWENPPYSGIIKNEYVCGRGAIDNKGMAVAQLFAVAQFAEMAKENNLPYNVSILSVSGEETDGLTGAYQVCQRFFSKINPHFVLGEGGSGLKGVIRSNPEKIVFGVSTVEKSKVILSLSMDISSSGHGSVPPKEYAMKEMIFALERLLKKKPKIEYNRTSVRALKEIGKYEKGIPGFMQRHFTFIFFRPIVKREIKKDPVILSFFANTYTFIKLIVPEGTNNMISNNANAIFDCRLLPNEKPDKFIKKIDKWVKDDRVKINILSQVEAAPKTNAPIIFSQIKASIDSVYPNSVILDMLFPATTDNNFFRFKGIPVFGIFPACFSEEELMSIHCTNEKIHFERLESAIKFYKIFLNSIITKENNLSLIDN